MYTLSLNVPTPTTVDIPDTFNVFNWVWPPLLYIVPPTTVRLSPAISAPPIFPVAVISPIILMVPVPLITLLLRSKSPPSWGVVSDTTSVIPVSVSRSFQVLTTVILLPWPVWWWHQYHSWLGASAGGVNATVLVVAEANWAVYSAIVLTTSSNL